MSEESLSTDELADDGAQGGSDSPDLAARLFLQLGPRVMKQSIPQTDDLLAETLIGSPRPNLQEDKEPSPSVAGLPARYRVRRELSRGGQGRVLLAWDSEAKRDVAIKLLLNAGERDVALLREECRVLARLEHPGIVRLYRIGELEPSRADDSHSSTPFLELEFVEGQTLGSYVRDQKPSVVVIVGLMARVAAAVGKAHEFQIVHRDLKPSNVLVTREGEPKVLDFGLAQDERSRQSLSLRGIGGTLSYMSPEQSRGEATDARTDVYSLGVTLYELLSGTFPIVLSNLAGKPDTAPSFSEKLRRIREQPAIPLRERDASLPRELEDICDRCLRKNADERYLNARELADDLNRFLEHRPVAAWRGRRGPHVVGKFIRRQRLPAVLVSFILVITLTSFWRVTAERNEAVRLAGVARTNEGRANDEKRRATDNAARAERNREQAEAARDESESRRFRLLVDSADRAIVARQFHDARQSLLEAEGRGVTWETARLKFEAGADRFTSQWLAEHHWGLTAAVLSPNRSKLVSAGADGALLVWDVRTGRVTQTLAAGELRADGRLRRHCAVSAQHELLTEPTPFVTGLCWLSDSDRFASASFDGSARIYSLAQPEVRTLPARPAALYSIVADARGESILIGDAHGGVSSWKATGDEFQLEREATVADSPITAIVRSTAGPYWFVGTERGEVLALSDATLAVIGRIELVGSIMSLDVAHHNDARRPTSHDLLAVASGHASVKVLAFGSVSDRSMELASLSLPKLSQQVHSVRWDRGGDRLLAVDDQGQLLEWDIAELVRSADEIDLAPNSRDAEMTVSRASRIPVPLLRATRAIGSPDNNPHRDPHRTVPLPLPLRRRATVLLPLDERRVIVGGEDVVLRVWDEPSAQDRTEFSVGPQPQLAFDPHLPTRLWSATGDGKLALHETGGPAPHAIAEVEAHRGAITGLVVLPKARLVATAGRDGAVRLWQRDAMRGLVAVSEWSHRAPLLSLAVSHHERWLAAVDEANRLIVWNVASKTVEQDLNLDDRDRSEPLTGAVAFNADDTRLAAFGAGQTSAVFDTAGFAKVSSKLMLAGGGGISLLWHSTDPDVMFATDSIRRFVSLDLRGREPAAHTRMNPWQPPTPFVALRGTPDKKRLLMIDEAGLLVSFDPALLGIVVTRDTGMKDVCALAVDRAGRRVAVADKRGNVTILEAGLVPDPLPDTTADAAVWQARTWFEEPLPFAVETKDFRLDAHGRLAILTQHETNRTSKEFALRFHAERPGHARGRLATDKLDEMIDPSGRIAGASHVWRLQPDDEPMVVYRRNVVDEPYAGEIMLARRSLDGVWNAHPISPPGGHGSFPAMHVRPDRAIDVFHFGYHGHFWFQTRATGETSQRRVLGVMGDGFNTQLGLDSLGRHHFAFRMNKFNGESGPPMYARLDGDSNEDVTVREPIDVASSGCLHFWIGHDDIPTAVIRRERSHGSVIFVVMRRHTDGWHEELLPAAFDDILERPDGSLSAVTWDATEEDAVFWEQRGTDWFPTPLRVTWPAAPNGLALRIDAQGEPVIAAIRSNQSPSWVREIRRVPRH